MMMNINMSASESNPNSEMERPAASNCRTEDGSKVYYILIAEDNLADEYLIRRAIKGSNLLTRIHVVRDGEQAILLFNASETDSTADIPDLIILDINLPRKQGGEVLRHMRESLSYANTRVIGVSTPDSPREREELTRLGAYAYFRKPAEYDDFMKLGQLVRDALTLP
jgi:chemotaxis family two-component system response regulator Rcp1